jgi:hypothetical protein
VTHWSRRYVTRPSTTHATVGGDRTDERPAPEEIARWEAALLAVSQRWFADIRHGDDTAIDARHSRRK